MTTKSEVAHSLIDDFHVWDDKAEELVEQHAALISLNNGKSAIFIADLVLDAEKERLDVAELPQDDYFSQDEEWTDEELEDEEDE